MMPETETGLDSRNLDLFGVEITTDTTNGQNNRSQLLLVLAYIDFVCKYLPKYIDVMGK